jgi:hypothetical protein
MRIGSTIALLFVVAIVMITVAHIMFRAPNREAVKTATLWVAGATVLGLLTGLTTGLSKATGTAEKYLGFLSAGILVPLIGGIAVLLQTGQTVTERYTYSGDQLTRKVTTTMPEQPSFLLHPIAVLGLFFAAYSCAAVVGILAGIVLKKSGYVIHDEP